MNIRKEADEDWFNVVIVGVLITFIYEGLFVLSCDIATHILWTNETEEAEVLSDVSDKLQWKFNSLGQNITFSCVGQLWCVMNKWKSTRMVQRIRVFLKVSS